MLGFGYCFTNFGIAFASIDIVSQFILTLSKMQLLNIKLSRYAIAVVLGVLAMGCHSLTKTQKGANIGAGAGGVIGAFIGKSAGNTALGAIIGGAVGGTAGAFIGKSMDTQAAELKQTIPGATVIRQDESIIVKFDSGILFDSDKADLKQEAQSNLQNLAASLQKNPHTNVLIIGHTDNSGIEEHNLDLSQKRAEAVKAYIASANIELSRLATQSRGDKDPIADNKTVEGRAQNRRVEIVISANEQMKKQAKNAF
jgi:outer membrane protein OmpA-like peptidoglycan-associated protein